MTKQAKKALIWVISPKQTNGLAQNLLDQGWEVISVEEDEQDWSLPSSKTISHSEASQMIRNLNSQAFGLIVIELIDFMELIVKDYTNRQTGRDLLNAEAIFALLQGFKEHNRIALVCSHEDYGRVSRSIKHSGTVDDSLLENLAETAMKHLAEHLQGLMHFSRLTSKEVEDAKSKQGTLPLSTTK